MAKFSMFHWTLAAEDMKCGKQGRSLMAGLCVDSFTGKVDRRGSSRNTSLRQGSGTTDNT